jgi:hypothetical protein
LAGIFAGFKESQPLLYEKKQAERTFGPSKRHAGCAPVVVWVETDS